MGWKENATEQQLVMIEELKRRTVNDVTPKMLKDDTLFYRFAKARDYNLKNAESMLRKNIAFRKEYGVDTILEDYTIPEVLKKYGTTNYVCLDNDGSPVRYIDIGKVDFKGIFNSARVIDIIKYNLYCVEEDIVKLENHWKKTGKSVSTIVYIYDYDKLSFMKATHKKAIELAMMGITVYQDNYPERIKSIYVINATYYFPILFNICKVVVAAAVMDKIRIFGTDGFQEQLLKITNADDLPGFLGGKRTDPDGDPLCKSTINHGQMIPECYYLTKSEKTLCRVTGVKKATVTRFSKLDVSFEVSVAGSFLEWEFETKARDIGFGVFFRGPGAQLNELVPKQRIGTDYETATGIYKCDRPGTYVLVFDNSYSWIFPKEIYYKARVIQPTDDASPEKRITL